MRITAEGPDKGGGWTSTRFAVRTSVPDAPPLLNISVLVLSTQAADVFGADESRLSRALALYGLPIIEAGLVDGSLAPYIVQQPSDRIFNIEVIGSQLSRVDREWKKCRYQLQHDSSDLFCDAGWEDGHRQRIEASRATCACCDVPDRRVQCSALHHPKVTSLASFEGTHTEVVNAECDFGRSDFHHGGCYPGGAQCWERWVELEPVGSVDTLPPLTIHESVDYLDAVWRNAFSRALLKMSVLAPGGVLATPCDSSQDFHAKLSALGEVFNAFDVQHEAKGCTGSLAKMANMLKCWGEEKGATPDEIADTERAILVLQQTLGLRAGQQHGPARDRFEKAVRGLGLSLPPSSYATEWNRLQGPPSRRDGDYPSVHPRAPIGTRLATPAAAVRR